MNSVPAERVAQIHIAGHSKYRKYILDTHDHPVIDPVWKLYERAIQRVGHTATLLEWDDSIPSFKEVHDEALKANKFLRVQRARDRRMKLLQLPAHHGSRGDAAAHLVRAHAAQSSRWPADARLRLALHQAQRPPHFVRTPRNLQSPVLVSRCSPPDRGFSRLARCSRRETLRRDVQGLPDRLPFAFVHAAQSRLELESWLRKHPKWAGTKQTLALDIVRLEWADIEAFDGKAEPALRTEDLAGAERRQAYACAAALRAAARVFAIPSTICCSQCAKKTKTRISPATPSRNAASESTFAPSPS